ncbi:uncharacterized protein LOC132340500 [Haemorhous mexicanus]|uniref:uncharacterized protein LOC132340500 n=1 Tax=Haemorhous mexicanus TaxID=30427 RepID=UPI0028BEF87D|nr:uncharacterized protein LOC132340500 [Haemorhous mexicanus]
MEPRESFPALLQPQVTVVATLGDLLATLLRLDEEMLLPVSSLRLHWDLEEFTRELRATLCGMDETSWCHNNTSDGDDPPTSLSRALAAYEHTPWTRLDDVTVAAIMCQGSVFVLVDRWAELARKATKLHNTCRRAATEVADMVVTAWARELPSEAACMREQARVAASQATRATMVKQRVEKALGLLERLVAVCDEATAVPRALQRLLRDVEAALKGTNEASPKVPDALVAKVADSECLWEANAHLAKDHLLGAVDDIIRFYFTAGPASPRACEVAERCQRASKDIPRLLRPQECPQSVPKVSPVSMEPRELALALLQPQVTMVAILGQLRVTLHSQHRKMLLFESPKDLDWDLKEFTEELWNTLGTDDSWDDDELSTSSDDDPPTADDDDDAPSPDDDDAPSPDDDDASTSDNDDPPTSRDDGCATSLSQALAAYKSSPGVHWNRVTMVARKWYRSLDLQVFMWAELARAATRLRNTWREVATKAADRAATITARARELQAEAARYGTAQENMVELGQALGGEEGAEGVAGREAQVRRDAWVAASQATRATMERQRAEAALGLLERLVAACDKATAFPRELQRRVRAIKAALKGTNEVSPNVPEDLVAKVAVAERLWEANARLIKDHLEGTLADITEFKDVPHRPCEVAELCQRAIEDIPRLLRPPECLQGFPKVSPMSVELQELSSALLQPQVTVVAILGELLGTLPWLDKMWPMSLQCLYWDLEEFTRDLWATLYHIDDTWWRRSVTFDNDDPPTSLSQALAAYKSTPGTSQSRVTMVARKWLGWVSVLVHSWAELAREATKLHNTWREVATVATTKVATTTTRAMELQAEAARYVIAQENMVELGLGLGQEEDDEVVARHEAHVGEEARVAASEATRATEEKQWVEAALGLLGRLVAACDEATAFPRELQCLLRDIKATLKGTNEASSDVTKDLVAKVAKAERLWEANTCLAKDYLVGTLDDIIDRYFNYGPDSPHCRRVAKRCQRAIEDIPRLLRPPECPQSIPKLSPVSMEPQELSLALLQPQVIVVAILGKLLANVPSLDEELLLVFPGCLYRDLEEFTWELQFTLYRIDDPWWRHNVTSDDDNPLTSLSRALAAYKSTPWTTWHDVIVVASEWQGSVSVLVERWAQLARAATKLRNTCREVAAVVADTVAFHTARARELEAEVARYGTAQENMMELDQALGGEEGAEVVARPEAQVRREARVAASTATRATMERQRVEEVLGLLDPLVATCAEATAFLQELQRRVGDIKTTLEGTNEVSPDVPEDLVAKVAEAERLWEANARLAKDHLLGAVDIITTFLFTGGPTTLRAPEVAERCRRATEDIPRLLQPPERPQGVPKVSPVSMEPQELSPALLHPQVTMVATLGELLATLPSEDEMNLLLTSPRDFYWQLKFFTWELRDIRDRIDNPWRRRSVTYDDDDRLASLSQALDTYKSTPGTSQKHVTVAVTEWQESVSVLANSCAQLARAAAKLRKACTEVVNEAADRAGTATARARELEAEAAPYGTLLENMMELDMALGWEEGAEGAARPEAQVRRDAWVADSEATTATMVKRRVEKALGLLERLVAACAEATAFPQELQRLLWDIKAALKGTNEVSPNVLKALVAKVALAEWLWKANARLVKDNLRGTVQIIIKVYFDGDPVSFSAREVTERCQRAIEDITRLVQPLEIPQGVPKVSPVSMELQEPSLSPLLEALVSMVATLGKVAATVTGPHRGVRRCVPLKSLHAPLGNFTWSLCKTLDHGDVTSLGNRGVTSLSQVLATLRATPGTSWTDARAAASAWRELVAALEQKWKRLKEAAIRLRDACEDVAPARAGDLQGEATRRGTAGDNLAARAQQLPVALDREEEASAGAMHHAQVAVATNEAVAEVVVATRRGQQAEVALGLLKRLVAACDKAAMFSWNMHCRLRDIETMLQVTNDVSPDVPEALMAKVAKAEQLWDASARLFNHHLLGALREIHSLLLRPYGGRGGPSGPSSRAVAKQCQKAITDIPRLLQDSDITAVMSSWQ